MLLLIGNLILDMKIKAKASALTNMVIILKIAIFRTHPSSSSGNENYCKDNSLSHGEHGKFFDNSNRWCQITLYTEFEWYWTVK